jgi:hypothetical protein
MKWIAAIVASLVEHVAEATKNGSGLVRFSYDELGVYLFADASRRDTCVEQGGHYTTLRGIHPPSVGGF